MAVAKIRTFSVNGLKSPGEFYSLLLIVEDTMHCQEGHKDPDHRGFKNDM